MQEFQKEPEEDDLEPVQDESLNENGSDEHGKTSIKPDGDPVPKDPTKPHS